MSFSLRCAHCGQFLPEGHVKVDRDGRTELVVRHICSAQEEHNRQEPGSVSLPAEQDKAT